LDLPGVASLGFEIANQREIVCSIYLGEN